MKKIILIALLITICLLLLVSCKDVESEKTPESTKAAESVTEAVCGHDWYRISNLNESTARDQCTLCGEIRLYTSPESLPKNYTFSGSFMVSTFDGKTGFLKSYSESVLEILNQGLWEKEVLASDFDYILKVSGVELYYDDTNGIIADFEANRQLLLNESEKDTIRGFLDEIFLIDFLEVPEVLVRIEKWNEDVFEGIVVNPLFSYLKLGDKISVALNNVNAEYPVGSLVYVSFDNFDDSRYPNIIEAEAIESHEISDRKNSLQSFSFSLVWNVWGISSYDSQSGRLVKSDDSPDPDKYITYYNLTDEEKLYIFELIDAIDIYSYPDEYDPNENMDSEPAMSLVLTVKLGDKVKVVSAEYIAISYKSDDEKGQLFLSVCKAIEDFLTSTEAWRTLPEYDTFYE